MGALDIVLSHISQGTTYSWDLTALISLGVPVSSQLRQRLLAGSTTQVDADQLRTLVRSQVRMHGRRGR
jgi:hypothetical protein